MFANETLFVTNLSQVISLSGPAYPNPVKNMASFAYCYQELLEHRNCQNFITFEYQIDGSQRL